ncbi:DUF6491 family protein [Phenylobacterium sp.]|uniref:DUF6491 family protein n=1 Tax=Phenylobacterium sp. TaxID=1871053 RepID=UPI00391CDA5A
MSWKIATAALAAGLLALSAAAPQAAAKSPTEPAAKPARQCFWASQVNSFASDDDRHVYVRVGVKDVYELEMFGRCHDVDWSQKIGIVSRGGSTICSGLDAEIIAPSPTGPQRCQVSKVRKLTEAEIKALPKRARP